MYTEGMSTVIDILNKGGVILYPTEGVWGLGCDPFREQAVTKLLEIKNRDVAKGLILITDRWDSVKGLIAMEITSDFIGGLEINNNHPTTWLLPATNMVPRWIRGKSNSVAIRVTKHYLAKKICSFFGSPLVSSSANISSKRAAISLRGVDDNIIASIDCIIPGKTGGLTKPSRIYDLINNIKVRK